MDALLTPDEVAAILKVSKSWLYGHVHARTLPFAFTKVGHYLRFPQSGVMKFVEQSTTESNSRRQ